MGQGRRRAARRSVDGARGHGAPRERPGARGVGARLRGDAAPSGAAFKLPAGAKLKLQIHYKKHWLDEQNAVKDKSTVGLYFTDAPVSGSEIQTLAIDGKAVGEAPTEPQTFSGDSRPPRASSRSARSSIRPTRPSTCTPCCQGGRRVPLLKLRAARPEWPRRYWLAEPIELPAGREDRGRRQARAAEPRRHPVSAPRQAADRRGLRRPIDARMLA